MYRRFFRDKGFNSILVGLSMSITITAGCSSAARVTVSSPFACDFEIRIILETAFQPLSDHRMVIDKQDPNCIASSLKTLGAGNS